MQISPGIANAVRAAQTSSPAPIKIYGIVFLVVMMLFISCCYSSVVQSGGFCSVLIVCLICRAGHVFNELLCVDSVLDVCCVCHNVVLLCALHSIICVIHSI